MVSRNKVPEQKKYLIAYILRKKKKRKIFDKNCDLKLVLNNIFFFLLYMKINQKSLWIQRVSTDKVRLALSENDEKSKYMNKYYVV
jgi:hypothetical protein